MIYKMTLSDYSLLKHQAVSNVNRSDYNRSFLVQLKEFYRDEIDSKRRFEQIDTLGQLLRILEIREVLSEDDVGPLKEIARRLKNNDLLKMIDDYEKSHHPREYINYYGIKNNTSRQESIEILPTGHPYGNISAKKKERINETIIEEIGTHWRDVARNLKIQEHCIDEIDKVDTMAGKITSLLKLYEHKADPDRGFYKLCQALEKARRKDLSKKLQKNMLMNL